MTKFYAASAFFLTPPEERPNTLDGGRRGDGPEYRPISDVAIAQVVRRCFDAEIIELCASGGTFLAAHDYGMGVTCRSIFGQTDTSLMVPLMQQSRFMAERDRRLRGQSCQHHPFAPTRALWPHLAAAGIG